MPETTPDPNRALALEEAAAHLEARAAAHTEGLDDMAGFVAKARQIEARHWNEAARELRAWAAGTETGTPDRTETGATIATAQAGSGAAEDSPADTAGGDRPHVCPSCDGPQVVHESTEVMRGGRRLPAPVRSDIGTEFVRQADNPDWVALDQVGHDTPGCDCGHDGMGAGWHANDCAWKSGMVTPDGWSTPTLREAIAGALRSAAFSCDGECGSDEAACDAAHPIKEAATSHGVISDVYGPIDAIAGVVAGVVQPALDELADYRNRITWETNCGEHARLLDSCRLAEERAEQAEEYRRALADVLGEPRGRDWPTLIGRAESMVATVADALRASAQEAAAMLRRTPRDSRDYPAVLTGARVIETWLDALTPAADQPGDGGGQ